MRENFNLNKEVRKDLINMSRMWDRKKICVPDMNLSL